jgi:hypothetical protein
MLSSATRRFGVCLATALALTASSAGWSAEGAAKPKKLLYFTKSSGFEHSPVKRTGDQPAYSEKLLVEWGKKAGYEVVCSKDGTLMNPDKIGQWDGFVFYATGNLTQPSKSDPAPPMTPEGKQALLDAIAAGKGFVGVHAANDAFHLGGDKVDPFILMLGGELIKHGQQQEAWMRIADPKFPGLEGLKDFKLKDEWYSHKNLAADMHVILIQDTTEMIKTGGDWPYDRPSYPATWARMQGKGRVYYTSMGHREDVWDNPVFQKILMGGIAWSVGDAKADVPTNIKEVTPGAFTMPVPGPDAKQPKGEAAKKASGQKKGGGKAKKAITQPVEAPK